MLREVLDIVFSISSGVGKYYLNFLFVKERV